MGPDTRRKLDDGFRRRIEGRRRDHAANWEHAVRVGHGLGLGEPLGLYHTEVTPALGARRVLLLTAPVIVFVVVVVLLMVWAPDAGVPVLGVSPCICGVYVVVCAMITRRRRFTRWLYGYTGGLAEVDPEGPPRPVRWDEVTDVVDEWSSAGSESSGWSYDGFRLTTADGRTVSVTAKYENPLDPLGVIATWMPADAGRAVPRIADLITTQAVARVVARQAAAVRGGAAVVRGGIRITRDGIAGPKDAAPTPWTAIERVELRPGRVRVHPIAGKTRKYTDYRDGSGYAVLCHLLLALGVTAAYEPTG